MGGVGLVERIQEVTEKLDAPVELFEVNPFVLGVSLGDGAGADGYGGAAVFGKDGGIAEPGGGDGLRAEGLEFLDEGESGIGEEGFGAGEADFELGMPVAEATEEFFEEGVVLPGDGSEVEGGLAEIGNNVGFASPAQGAGVNGRVTEEGVGEGSQPWGELIADGLEDVGHGVDGVGAELGACPVGGDAAGGEGDEEAALVGVHALEFGGFGGEDQVEGFGAGEGVGSVLTGLFSDEGGEPDFVGEFGEDGLP